ncbi:MAG: SMR family transporter [Patescibacteria group bacterium]
MVYLFLTFSFILNALGNVLLKIGAVQGLWAENYNIFYLVAKNYVPISGLALFALSAVFYFLSLREIPLSTAYPVLVMMCFLLISAFSYFYFHENISWPQLLGYCMIAGGLILVFWFTSK